MSVRCVKCGAVSDESPIRVDVESAELNCSACDETYTVADVEQHLEEWRELLAWIGTHPAVRKPTKSKAG